MKGSLKSIAIFAVLSTHVLAASTDVLRSAAKAVSKAEKKDVLVYEGGAQTITNKTSCDSKKWGNNVVNSCSCCVIKNAPKGPIRESLEAKVMDGCVQKKYCSDETIRLITGNPEASQKNFKGIVKKIIDGNTVLHNIDMTGEYLGKDGQLDDKTAVNLLNNAIAAGYLAEPSQHQSFTAKKSGGGGAQTLQLIKIKEGDALKYILKEMKKPFEETKNLQIIKQSSLKEYLLNSKVRAERQRPALAMDAQNFVYTYNGKPHYMSLIDIANGNDIATILFDWTHDPKNAQKKERARKAVYRLGQNIGIIHVAFMQPKGSILGKTFVHGDMHPYNIFYDDENDRIIFIDNESFALSIKSPRDASLDIMKFYGRLVATNIIDKHAYLQRGMDEEEYYDTVIRPFIVGYVDAYGSQRESAFQAIYKLMTSQGALKTYLDNNKTILSPTELYRSQQYFLKPLFVKISKYERLPLDAQAKTSLLARGTQKLLK